MRAFLILSMLLTTAAQAGEDGYCAAIRGNGENVAAHWASLSRMVEEHGMPEAMAGGSSATVTMFFMNSIAANGAVKSEADPEKKRRKEALLIKSLSEYISEMARNDQAVNAYAFLTELSKQDSATSEKLKQILQSSGGVSPSALSSALQKYLPLMNPEMITGLVQRPDFFRTEMGQALQAFGKFDAVKDEKIFLRPGLVDFKEFALNLGNIADFYAGNTDEETRKELERFTDDCAEGAYQKQFSDISPDGCKARFHRIVTSYLQRGNFQNKALFEKVGVEIPSLPTTSLIQGQAVQKFKDLKTGYSRGEDRDYGDFSVDFTRELKFGYWTGEGDKIKRGLLPYISRGDLKAQKFEALAPGNWFEVLSTSPAEPGLASILPIPVGTTREKVLAERRKPPQTRWSGLKYDRNFLSAGGWSDLHPVEVLKASGCDRVAYFSRKDGDSVFAQQVFIRLTGSQSEIPFWEKLGESNNAGWRVDGAAERSPWNRLYNYGNPGSAFNQALNAADLVYCTDWNRYKPLNGQNADMEKEAYGAAVLLSSGTPLGFRVNKVSTSPTVANFPGCVPMRHSSGVVPAADGAATRPAN